MATTKKTAGASKKAPVSKKTQPGQTQGRGKATRKKAAKRSIAEQPLMAALRAEHKHIATVMELFSAQLDAIEGGELVDTHVVYEVMHYMNTWPDRFHHPREDLIYSRVAEVDASAADNVDSLQREHDEMAKEGRAVLRDIEKWRNGEVTGVTVIKSGREYIGRMYTHMNNEEGLVFPQIESVLTLQDWRDLTDDDQLRPVSDPIFGGRIDREFRNLARKLRRGLRHSVERGAMVEWIGLEALMESLEVMSMAYDSAREVTGDYARAAWDDSVDIVKETPLTAGIRIAASNARHGFSLAGDMLQISKDTLEDISRVNQERRDRVRIMDGNTRG